MRVRGNQRFEQANAFLVLALQRLAHFQRRLVQQLVGQLVGEALERRLRIRVLLQLRDGALDGALLDQLGAVA